MVKSQANFFDQFKMSIFNANNWFSSSATQAANLKEKNENDDDVIYFDEKSRLDNKANINPYVKVSYAGITVICHYLN
jgi:predicted phosphohydrolase